MEKRNLQPILQLATDLTEAVSVVAVRARDRFITLRQTVDLLATEERFYPWVFDSQRPGHGATVTSTWSRFKTRPRDVLVDLIENHTGHDAPKIHDQRYPKKICYRRL